MFYTYAHYKPEGGLFYIGKGAKNRAYDMKMRNVYWKNVVAKYGQPIVEILANWKTEQEALDHEKLLISSFKDMGFKLANLTNGGEGVSGYKHTQKAIQKMRGRTGEKSPMFGKPKSAEVKLKISQAKTGKKQTEEFKKKISEGFKGRIFSVEHLQKISESLKGRQFTQEHKDKMRVASQKQVKCPHCDKIGARIAMGRWHFNNCKNKENLP